MAKTYAPISTDAKRLDGVKYPEHWDKLLEFFATDRPKIDGSQWSYINPVDNAATKDKMLFGISPDMYDRVRRDEAKVRDDQRTKDEARAIEETIAEYGAYENENFDRACLPVCFLDELDDSDYAALGEFFQGIKYYVDGDGDGTILITDYRTKTVQTVSLSGRCALQNLTAACKRARRDANRTFADFFQKDVPKLFSEVLEETCKGKRSNEDLIGAALVKKGLPRVFLREAGLNIRLKRVTDEAGKLLMQAPSCLWVKNKPIPFLLSEADLLMHFSELVQLDPPKILSNRTDEACLHRLIIDIDAPGSIARHGECPTWDKYVKRYTKDEQDVLMAFIWSIFDVSNNGRQMLYILDNGYTGKSAMLNAIAETLGPELVMTLQKDSLNNQFSLAKIWDKRLVMTPDNKNPNLVRSEKVHMILGGDVADIERKGKESFSFKLQCKYIASGNTPLKIDTGALHESSRVIVIQPKVDKETMKEYCLTDENGELVLDPEGHPKPKGDPAFKRRLVQEFPFFLAKCKAVYDVVCPGGSDIPLPNSIIEKMQALDDDKTIAIAEACIGNLQYMAGDFVPWTDFEAIVSDWKIPDSDNKAGDVLTFMQKRHPDVVRTRDPKTRHYIVKNVRQLFDPTLVEHFQTFLGLAFEKSANGHVTLAQFWLCLTEACQRGGDGFETVRYLGLDDVPKRIDLYPITRRFYSWLLTQDGISLEREARASQKMVIKGLRPLTLREVRMAIPG